MELSALPQTNRRFKQRVSVGLLVAGGVAVGLTAPSWASSHAHQSADNYDGPVTGNSSDAASVTGVHEATQTALLKVVQQAPKAVLTSAVKAIPSVPGVREYRVRANDTLSGIAQSQLGNPSKYMEIFDINKGKPQPGGGSLTDPDVIQVGWVLQLPQEQGMRPQAQAATSAKLTVAAKPATKRPAASTGHATIKHPATVTHPAAIKHPATIAHPVAIKHPATPKTSHAAVTGGSPQEIARSIVPAGEFGCFSEIISHESGWNVHAVNPSSGAYGLPQSLPGDKMASAGPDWRNDATTQIHWALTYMDSRYGSPCDAWSFWQAHNWY